MSGVRAEESIEGVAAVCVGLELIVSLPSSYILHVFMTRSKVFQPKG